MLQTTRMHAIEWIKFLRPRRKIRCLLVVVSWAALLLLVHSWSQDVSRALQPPPPLDQNLDHFRRNTHLKYYLAHTKVLIEPPSPCPQHDLPIIVLVTSSPHHEERRKAIRSTWGTLMTTFFVIALRGFFDEKLVDNFVEAKLHRDILIFDMPDHYQNLTLKTVLMLQWSRDRCPHARHVLKTDDDVFINPWTLKELLSDHADAKLIGYRLNNTRLHRDKYTKWYIPRWLHNDDFIPQYLTGGAYIINEPQRKIRCRCLLVVVSWAALLLLVHSWSQDVSRALQPLSQLDQNLDHFRRNTHLKHYMAHTKVLIEPPSPCPQHDLPIIVLVTSSPHHEERRKAIRSTWGTLMTTFFVIALRDDLDKKLVVNFGEAKLHKDILIFDMLDHYQNLTLKTVLMLQWSRDRCPHARHVLKTDDDVFINPWTLKELLDDHADAKLIGYRLNNTRLHRDKYTKWYIPRWLHNDDFIPQYLTGGAYIINGLHLANILEAAEKTPLINIEDIYLTYLVSKSVLGYDLVHDRRLGVFKPWIPFDCAYWCQASMHSLSPREMVQTWVKITRLAGKTDVCWFFKKYLDSDMFLH